MNRDDVTRWAREANRYASNQTNDSHDWQEIRDERLAQAAYAAGAAAEREEILAFASSESFNRQHGERSPYAYELAAAIRARGQA